MSSAVPLDKLPLEKGSDLEKYISDGNKAVEFRMIRSVADLDDTSLSFQPFMCHQVFNEGETIFGYENLRIKVYFTAGSLKAYLGVSYKKTIPKGLSDGVMPDDINSKLQDVLRGGFTTNLNEFSALIDEEQQKFSPSGELVHGFKKKIDPLKFKCEISNGNTAPRQDRQFEIYMVDLMKCPKFVDYLRRMESFVLFYIDAATFLECDPGHDRWKFFVVYEKFKTSEGNTQYEFVGYSSVFEFFVYPDLIRPRVAQMLFLPMYQKQGMGVQLLRSIYNYYRNNPQVVEITVEDPSDDFELLRDFVDTVDCKNLSSYAPEKLKLGFSKAMIEEAHNKLKLTKRQARRVYEILRLNVTNIHNDIEFKEFRLDVKRRLNIPYQKQESDLKRMLKRKINCPEVQKAAALDDGTRKTELESNFKLLLSHYRNVLNRVEKYD